MGRGFSEEAFLGGVLGLCVGPGLIAPPNLFEELAATLLGEWAHNPTNPHVCVCFGLGDTHFLGEARGNLREVK